MKWLARGVAMIIGCTSLMAEVLWMRIVSFAEAGRADIFASVLGVYLFGIAVGAHLGKRICARPEPQIVSGLFTLLLASTLFDPLSLIIYSSSAPVLGGYLAALPWIIGGSALKGAVFPIVHHLGSNDQLQLKGASFSTVYVCNLAGCMIGPGLTALVTLDHLSTAEHFSIIAALSALAAIGVAIHARLLWIAAIPIAALIPAAVIPDPLRATATGLDGTSIAFWLENKEGVIHSTSQQDGAPDTVYGGNAYDGRININLRTNTNGIDRVHALMLAHPAPSSALVIGLSGGSWTRIISGYPTTRSVHVVEINPGYIGLISRYDQVRPILFDRRISFFFDDGRRWLRSNPAQRYDVIAINSTYHWRAGATNLLSREFMEELKIHLNPGGIALLNTTGSVDVVKTAATVFDNAYVYGNAVLMSDVDFRENIRSGSRRLFDVRLDATIDLYPTIEEDQELVDHVTKGQLRTLPMLEKEAGRFGEIVTDFNMITEYRRAQY